MKNSQNRTARISILDLGPVFASLDAGSRESRLEESLSGMNSECRALILRIAAAPKSPALSADGAIQALRDSTRNMIRNSEIPVICSASGALDAHLSELSQACHICLGGESATFVFPRLQFGGIGQPSQTREHGAQYKTFSSGQLKELGLINHVLPEDLLDANVQELAGLIADCAPVAVRSCLEAVIRGSGRPLNEGLEIETELFSSIFDTRDMKEGVSAFLEKRPAEFTGE